MTTRKERYRGGQRGMMKGKGENSIKMVEERQRERLKKRRNGSN